jgi:SDR family mycofactocin-dependent oxidoreductase
MQRPRFTGKVAMVTGAARGQGRSHAVRLAAEGADLILCDLGADIDTVPYALGTEDELRETAAMVGEHGSRAVVCRCDVRSTADLADAVSRGLDELGRIDVLVANAGIAGVSTLAEMSDDVWQNMIDVNLTGVFKTLRAVVPHMVSRGYGRIVATSSIVGRQGSANIGHYVAAKWGVLGLVKSLAVEVAEHGVTVNAVCPTSVDSEMIQNETFHRLFLPEADEIRMEDVEAAYTALNPIPVPWLSPNDVSDAVLFLASDEARLITGDALPVALGWNARMAA